MDKLDKILETMTELKAQNEKQYDELKAQNEKQYDGLKRDIKDNSVQIDEQNIRINTIRSLSTGLQKINIEEPSLRKYPDINSCFSTKTVVGYATP